MNKRTLLKKLFSSYRLRKAYKTLSVEHKAAQSEIEFKDYLLSIKDEQLSKKDLRIKQLEEQLSEARQKGIKAMQDVNRLLDENIILVQEYNKYVRFNIDMINPPHHQN